MKKFQKIFFIIASFLMSCEDVGERAIDTKTIAQEVKDRKPKRVTEADLAKWVNVKGQEITRITQKHLFRAVIQALETKKIKKPTEFKVLPEIPQIDSLAQVFEIKIDTYSINDKLDTKTQAIENQIFKSYQNSDAEWISQVKVDVKNQEILFHNPIVFDNELVGMWAIKFPRQQAIRFFDRKEILGK
jgi:hypothetical protein